MSLINDALKQARASTPPPPPGAPQFPMHTPLTPPPVPGMAAPPPAPAAGPAPLPQIQTASAASFQPAAASSAARNEGSPRGLVPVLVTALVLLGLLIAGATVLGFLWFMRNKTSPPVAAVPAPVAAATTATATPTPSAAAAALLPPGVKAPAANPQTAYGRDYKRAVDTALMVAAQHKEVALATEPAAPVMEANPARVKHSTTTATTTVADAKPPAGSPPPHTAATAKSKEPAKPAIKFNPDTYKLTGIMTAGGSRIALINGRIMRKGDHLGDAEVTEIEATRVLLRFGDSEFDLILPGSNP